MHLLQFCFHVTAWSLCVGHTDEPLALIISLDGFRWDYLEIAAKHGVKTPNFNKLLNEGVLGRMKPSYPSITFPNHWSIVTGLFVESHGMVGNAFIDPKLGKFVAYQDDGLDLESTQTLESKWFAAAEPIWVTNQKQDCDHQSGVYFWPGCGAPVQNILPSFHKSLHENFTSYADRIEQVVTWFDEDEINLGVLYFEEPDIIGHKFGPDSKEVSQIVGVLDNSLGLLMQKLKEKHLDYRVNVVILSDHGMRTMVDPHVNCIDLDNYLPRSWYELLDGSIYPHGVHSEEIYRILKKVPQLKVYKRSDIPPEYHFSDNLRIGSIYIEPEDGLLVVQNKSAYLEKNTGKILKGNHGYNNSAQDMQPIFIATGPRFKKGYSSIQPFLNVDVYPLLCHILGLTPAPNNGSLKRIQDVLVPEHQWSDATITVVTFLVVVVLCVAFTTAFIIGACRASASHKIIRRTVAMQFLNESSTSNPHKESSVSLLVSEGEDTDFGP